MTIQDPARAIEAVWRIESPKIVAVLARMVRDVGVAEDLAQDALVAALEQWPAAGTPDKPGAWLMAAAKHRAIDHLRRRPLLDRKHAELGYALESRQNEVPDLAGGLDDDIGDDMLRLIFTACHPALSPEARAALALRLLGGLTTAEIARSFLVSEPTMAQRLVRAKKTLADRGGMFEIPGGADRVERLSSVLEVVYLIFNEGYAATAGDDWMRPALCDEALHLGRILAELMPDQSEIHALVALMELQASRTNARLGPSGEPIPLLEQTRSRWNHVLIARGMAALARAQALGGAGEPYALQAAIAAGHARARTAGETDWTAIAALYDTLAEVSPSPVVEVNRAVAYGMAFGPAAGLALVDRIAGTPALDRYHLLPGVRADLLSRLGRVDEARQEWERAASLTNNARERAWLLDRARQQ